MPPRPTRVIAGFMSLAVFLTNGVLAHSAESNFWAERRRRLQGDEPVQVAGLPGRSSDVLRQLPALDRATSSPSLASSVAEALPPGFLRSHAELLNALSQPLGTVRRVALPENGDTGKT